MATTLRFSEDDLRVKPAPARRGVTLTHLLNLVVFSAAGLLLAIGALAS